MVPRRTAVPHQPAEGPLGHPPFRQPSEPLRPWPPHHLHIDTRTGAVVEDAALVAVVGPGLRHGGAGCGQVVEQELAAANALDNTIRIVLSIGSLWRTVLHMGSL